MPPSQRRFCMIFNFTLFDIFSPPFLRFSPLSSLFSPPPRLYYRCSTPTEYRITVFVKMFDRKKGRTSRKIRKRTNFITAEHFYEDDIRIIRLPHYTVLYGIIRCYTVLYGAIRCCWGPNTV